MEIEDHKGARYRAARRVTLVGGVVNVLLAVFKLGAGLVGGSAAMVADGVHSLSDLASDVVVLVGMRLGKREADRDHPWGHGKYETLATSILAMFLLAVALGVAVDAVIRLQDAGALRPPGTIALYAALLSIVSKEVLFRYTLAVGHRWDAAAVVANAWHHRSDAISSVAALIGVAGARLGVPLLDPLAAIVVAVILAKVGGELLVGALRELTDSVDAVDDAVRHQIADLVREEPSVLSAHSLRARRLGPDVLVDVHVVVGQYLSVSEGHQIAEHVETALLQGVSAVSHVMVHVDTADDGETGAPVPLYDIDRAHLLALARATLPPSGPLAAVTDVTPHFTPTGVNLDVAVTVSDSATLTEVREAARAFERALGADTPPIQQVRTHIAL